MILHILIWILIVDFTLFVLYGILFPNSSKDLEMLGNTKVIDVIFSRK